MKSGITMEHRGSVLLNAEENKQVFELIGNRCLVMFFLHLFIKKKKCHCLAENDLYILDINTRDVISLRVSINCKILKNDLRFSNF